MKVFILTVLFFLAFTLKGQNNDLYEVATWAGFTDAAITYTFDDNTAKQYTVAIPLLNEFDFDATFFPVINWSPNWTVFQNAVNEGHEIGSHTVTHADLGTLEDEEEEPKLKNSQSTVNSNVSGQSCLTIAYPYCAPGNKNLCKQYYFAARHCQGYVEKTTPDDFFSISSIICGSAGKIKKTSDFDSVANLAASTKGWAVYLIHGIDNDGGYSALSSDTLRHSLEYLDGNRDKFWVSTFGNVARYIRERDCATITEISAGSESIQLQLTDTLSNNSIFNYPISIRREIDQTWVNANVKQDGKTVASKTVDINDKKYIQFDAVPDGGDIIIYKEFTSGLGPDSRPAAVKIRTIPDNILISFQAGENPEGFVSVYNMNGMKVAGFPVTTGNHTLSKNTFGKGVYIVTVTDGSSAWSKKIAVF